MNWIKYLIDFWNLPGSNAYKTKNIIYRDPDYLSYTRDSSYYNLLPDKIKPFTK